MDEQKVQLLAQSLSLSSPSADDVAKAYRSLSSRGSITVACGSAELRAQLAALERAGFHGMRLEGATIRAWKGKEGPCHDTGRSARYRGSAAAAMDDDHHLIYGRIRVC